MRVLHVIANPKPLAESACKQVTRAFFETLKAARPEAMVVTVDLEQDPPPYYSYQVYRYFWYPVFQPGYQPTAQEKTAAAYAERQGKLFNGCDLVVLTTPMWNFAAPAALKAWMDQVLSPGLTFTIDAQGVKPLHQIKGLVVLAASGGAYEEGDRRNNLIPQIRAAFGFIGLSEPKVAWADGQNTFFFQDHAARREKAIARARELAKELTSF
jgi:FMN-dependent NADH-azoreductase